MAISWELIFRGRSEGSFRIVSSTIRCTGDVGIPVRLSRSLSVRVRYWLRLCKSVIWRLLVANRGYYITPHVVKEIQDTPLDTLYSKRHYTSVDTHYYSYIAEGMRGAVTGTAYGGTCRGAALPDIEVCGKTGTSENPHGKDHSIFMGFAPYQKPKVAIAVFVENAGFGATYAVPIGKLMLEKYLKGEISEANKATEEYIMNAVILPNNAL